MNDSISLEYASAEAVVKPAEPVDRSETLLISWNGKGYTLAATRYLSNDNLCLVLLSAAGNVECKVSVNLSKLPDTSVHVKNYSENRGILAVLTGRGFLRDTGQSIRNGSQEFALCDITDKLAGLLNLAPLPEVKPEAPQPPPETPDPEPKAPRKSRAKKSAK